MVAFDNDFQRLGYGGGNYDEYLGLVSREKNPGANVEIIGVAFETQRVNRVPTEPHEFAFAVHYFSIGTLLLLS